MFDHPNHLQPMAAAARFWRDRARVREGRLLTYPIMTDIVGMIGQLHKTYHADLDQMGRAITLSLDDQIPMLVLDADRVMFMVRALLDAARAHTPQSDLTLTIAHTPAPDEQLSIQVCAQGGAINPMADARCQMLFDEAQWQEACAKAAGDDAFPSPDWFADLAWCHMLAPSLGGQLDYTVPSNGGASEPEVVWHLVLNAPPAVETVALDIDEEEDLDLDDPLIAVSRGLGLRAKTILVVEDAAVASRLIKNYLQRMGHHVCLVDHGAAALEAVKTDGFDMVLLDLTLPDMSGWDVMQGFDDYRRHGQMGPVYAFTASTDEGLPERLAAAGFAGLLKKPVDWDQLRNLLAETDGASPEDAVHPFQLSQYVADWGACMGIPVLDTGVQQQLVEILGDEALNQLISQFLDQLDDFQNSLGALEPQADDPVWRKNSHDMKSMAGSMGGMRLSQMAHVLTHHGWPDDQASARADLTRTIDQTRAVLSNQINAAP
ncbi:MAG: response regulator [Pseudomonadota bacterium]